MFSHLSGPPFARIAVRGPHIALACRLEQSEISHGARVCIT